MNADVIASYLAGRLPASESDAFEQAVADHPDVCRAVEQTLKLQEGLARLRERGELSTLLRAPAPRRWIAYAAAASVALATLASVLWLQLRGPAAATLVLSPTGVAARHHALAAIRGTYVLARTRGSAGVVDVRLPTEAGLIELKIVPSDVSAETRYSVRLRRLAGSAGGENLGQIDAGPAASDGYVTVYVDSTHLTRGEYEVSVTGFAPRTDAESDRFVIRVR
jgi:hypothetical protein